MSEEIAIGLYRATTAHWANGKVTTIYVKEAGQGSKAVLEQSSDCNVELGGEYSLVLQPVQGAETGPLPITPEFPELPTPEVPIRPENPIGTLPPEGVMPGRPTLPPGGVMPTLPPWISGVMPSLPGGIATLPWYPPQGVTPTVPPVPEGVTPEVPPASPEGVTPEVPPVSTGETKPGAPGEPKV